MRIAAYASAAPSVQRVDRSSSPTLTKLPHRVAQNCAEAQPVALVAHRDEIGSSKHGSTLIRRAGARLPIRGAKSVREVPILVTLVRAVAAPECGALNIPACVGHIDIPTADRILPRPFTMPKGS